MASELQSHLLESIANMYDDNDGGHDVEVVVGVVPQERFKAHKMILRAISPHFKEMLKEKSVARENGKLVLKLPDVNPSEFKILLKYIYTGSVVMAEVLRDGVQGILHAAEKLQLDIFLKHVQDELIFKQQDWLKSHLIETFRSISAIQSCGRLHAHCLELLNGEAESSNSRKSTVLSHDILKAQLMLGTVDVNQIDAWRKIVDWGVSQIPGLSKNVEMWTKAEFEMLKEKVKDLVPLVRFEDIDPVDFCRKIMPYKRIIPKILFKEILYLYLDPIHSTLAEHKLLFADSSFTSGTGQPEGFLNYTPIAIIVEDDKNISAVNDGTKANNDKTRAESAAYPLVDRSTWIGDAVKVTNIFLHGGGMTFPFRPTDYKSIAAIVNIKYPAISILFNEHEEARITIQQFKMEDFTRDGCKVVIRLISEGKIKYYHHPNVFPSLPHKKAKDPTSEGSLSKAQIVVLMLQGKVKKFYDAVQSLIQKNVDIENRL